MISKSVNGLVLKSVILISNISHVRRPTLTNVFVFVRQWPVTILTNIIQVVFKFNLGHDVKGHLLENVFLFVVGSFLIGHCLSIYTAILYLSRGSFPCLAKVGISK